MKPHKPFKIEYIGLQEQLVDENTKRMFVNVNSIPEYVDLTIDGNKIGITKCLEEFLERLWDKKVIKRWDED